MALFLSFLFFLLVSLAAACDRCVQRSKATYYYEDNPTTYGGACGYGNLALNISKGHFAAAVPSLYRKGAGCGACYQIRCKKPKMCTKPGRIIVVTDRNDDNRTDFVLSREAFSKMALKGKGEELLNMGVVDVEYKRVPCPYKNLTLKVRVEEWSHKPDYLAIKFLYQAGQTDIQAVDISQVGASRWGAMKRNYGAIWDSNNVARGALQLRMAVSSKKENEKWVWADNALPADWSNGQIYDTGIQIKGIATENCPPPQCGDAPWK